MPPLVHVPPLVEEGNQQLRITVYGALFYIRSYEQYREVYPNVETRTPTKTEAAIMGWLKSTKGKEPMLAQVKRWSRSLEETAAEIGSSVSAETLMRFENGQSVQPEQQEQILNWLSQ